MQTLDLVHYIIIWWLIAGLVQYAKIVNKMAKMLDFTNFAINSFLLLLFLPAMPLIWVMTATMATALETMDDEAQ